LSVTVCGEPQVQSGIFLALAYVVHRKRNTPPPMTTTVDSRNTMVSGPISRRTRASHMLVSLSIAAFSAELDFDDEITSNSPKTASEDTTQKTITGQPWPD
jgi:hypothetical protein